MPSTISGVAVFVVLLLPGFVFLARIETRQPGREYSAFRELATVLTTSVVIDAIVLSMFGLIRVLLPDRTPDVGALVRDQATYVQMHYVSLLIWVAALFGAATLIASLAAVPPVWFVRWLSGQKVRPLRALALNVNRASRNLLREESGWSAAFHRHPTTKVWLGVHLKDGGYLSGGLVDFNPQIAENDERSLQIAGPVSYRPAGDDVLVERSVGVVVVPASEIQLIEVTYLEDPSRVGSTHADKLGQSHSFRI